MEMNQTSNERKMKVISTQNGGISLLSGPGLGQESGEHDDDQAPNESRQKGHPADKGPCGFDQGFIRRIANPSPRRQEQPVQQKKQ